MQANIPEGRLKFLDGLRGLAALSVAVMHCCYSMRGPRFEPLPDFHGLFQLVCRQGSMGVEVFFVLSGFVIAHSIRGVRISPGYLGNFALRRSLRLDPPYWAAILLVAIMKLASNVLIKDRVDQISWSLGMFVANLTYTQYLFETGTILGVAWTLCLEVQFYLVFIALTGLAQCLAGATPSQRTQDLAWAAAFGPLILVSCVSHFQDWGHLNDALFVKPWQMFFTGVLVHRALQSPPWTRACLALLAADLALAAIHSDPRRPVTTAITGAVILAAGRAGGLATWLNVRWIQYLGTISYSLYLVHEFLQAQMINFAARHLPRAASTTVLMFVLAMTVSLVAALLMYILVERPSVAFGKRLRGKPTPERKPIFSDLRPTPV